MCLRISIIAATFFLASMATSLAYAERDIWLELLKVLEYSNTARASFVPHCRAGSPSLQIDTFKVLCPKLKSIPNKVIESAALPYLKKHVDRDVAQEAIAFWSTERAKSVNRKIVLEIESGVHDQLSDDDLRLVDFSNRTSYGRALKAFSSDKEGSSAIARAMILYEP